MENLRFGPFCLDPTRRVLIHRDTVTTLRPKTLDVLLLLLRRAGDVVSKDEIFSTVWADVAVSEYVLTTCVSELRSALGDSSRQPVYLRTVHGTGYQFTADVRGTHDAPAAGDRGTSGRAAIVDRDRELAQLNAALQRVRAGQRQVVFITGEMGIGKTTLADLFAHGVTVNWQGMGGAVAPPRERFLIARGQCIAQFGAGEPYMPVLEAIGRLAREADGGFVTDVLRQHTPAWLIQIPGVLSPQERVALRAELSAQTQEHMLRLIADGIETLCERHPLVLLLEDLHLSDPATLELVAALAMRRGPARLLLLGTFRSGEEHAASSPFLKLQRQLHLHRQCEEIALAPLTSEAVATYLAERFIGLQVPSALAATIHARTEGNPLFVGRLIDQLLDEGVLLVDPVAGEVRLEASDLASHVPHSLRALVEQRVDAFSAPEREIVEAAGVAGVNFWSACVAAVLGKDREEIEEVCGRLSRRDGLLAAGEVPDIDFPDLGARFRFSHALYQQVVYERVEITRRQRLHRAVGHALREAWAGRAAEIAAELASHFERGGDLEEAIAFYDKAAIAAAEQAANREAAGYLDRALGLLDRGKDPFVDRERRLDLLMSRGPSVLTSFGYGSIEVLHNYESALDLARQLDNPMRQMACLLALSICEQTRARLVEGEQLALELVRVAEQVNLPQPLIAQLRNPLSQVRMYQGALAESLALSDAAVAAAEVLSMPAPPADSRPALWAEPRVMLHCQRAAASAALGRLAQAGDAVEQALGIARELRHPFNLAYATTYAALYHDTMGQWDEAVRLARQAIGIARDQGFPFWEGVAKVACGHALSCSDDPSGWAAILNDGIAIWLGTGARLATTMHYRLLADACLADGDVDGAHTALAVAEAHAEQTGEKVFLAEIYRLQAECRRRAGAAPEEIAQALRRSLDVARRQGAKLWELHATLALYRLQPTAKTRDDLARICAAFDSEPASPAINSARAALAT